LFKHLESKARCPGCDVELDKSRRDALIKPDRVLQSLLDKMFPDLADEDRRNEAEFYTAKGILLKDDSMATPRPQARPAAAQPVAAPVALSTLVEISMSLVVENPSDFPDLARVHFLRTTNNLQILHVKKYIGKLTGLPVENIAVSCNGEELGGSLTLEFVQRTRWQDPHKDMVLTFKKKAA
jgi:hypothetical protein